MRFLEQVILENKCCPLCCGGEDVTLFAGQDLLSNLPGEFNVVMCMKCSLMRTNPRPTRESIGLYYPDNYGPYLGTRVQKNSSVKEKKFIRNILGFAYRKLINFNMTRIPNIPPGKMLEIGCASGNFLHKMALKGWSVQGIEFSEKAGAAAAELGYPVHIGALETAVLSEDSFDLIVGWMVLEHLHDPIFCLKKLREWAKPGAYLALSVPNANSLEFKIFKNQWYALQLPTHLYHYTPKTLNKVLFEAGWKLEKVFHQRNLNNLIASFGYFLRNLGFVKLGNKLIELPDRSSILMYVFYPLALILSVFGQTGRMTIWARTI